MCSFLLLSVFTVWLLHECNFFCQESWDCMYHLRHYCRLQSRNAFIFNERKVNLLVIFHPFPFNFSPNYLFTHFVLNSQELMIKRFYWRDIEDVRVEGIRCRIRWNHHILGSNLPGWCVGNHFLLKGRVSNGPLWIVIFNPSHLASLIERNCT